MTKENFQSLSKATDITLFTAEYEQFLELMESLQGDSGHSDDKRLNVPKAEQSALFNKLYPGDLGVTKFAKTSPEDLRHMLGSYNLHSTLTPLTSIKAGIAISHPIWQSFGLQTHWSFVTQITQHRSSPPILSQQS